MPLYFRVKRLLPFLLVCLLAACKKNEKEDDKPVLSSDKKTLYFRLYDAIGTIDTANHTIDIVIPAYYDQDSLYPRIVVSQSAKIEPEAVELSLTGPVKYKVIAEDGSFIEYTVNARLGTDGNNLITGFSVSNGLWREAYVKVDTTKNIAYVDIPYRLMDPSKLITEFQLPHDAMIVPASGDTLDFTKPVKFTVTAQNGEKREYTAIARNNDTYFSYPQLPLHGLSDNDYRFAWADSMGYVNANVYPEDIVGLENKAFVLYYALESEDISNVFLKPGNVPGVPVIPVNATISPSPDLPQNFNNDVTYKVTAETGDVVEYVMRVVRKKIIIGGMGHPVGGYPWVGLKSGSFNYLSDSRVSRAWFINSATGASIALALRNPEYHSWGFYSQSFTTFNEAVMPSGTYRLKVQLEDGTEELTTYTILVK